LCFLSFASTCFFFVSFLVAEALVLAEGEFGEVGSFAFSEKAYEHREGVAVALDRRGELFACVARPGRTPIDEAFGSTRNTKYMLAWHQAAVHRDGKVTLGTYVQGHSLLVHMLFSNELNVDKVVRDVGKGISIGGGQVFVQTNSHIKLTLMSDAGVPKQLDIVLDRTSPIPLYHQLAEAIEAAITCGELGPGDRLENELSLTSRLGLARPTARQAIGELARKGLVVRKRGVGTQVLSRQINRETRLSSLHDDLEAAGRSPKTQLLSYALGPASPDLLSCGADIDPGINLRKKWKEKKRRRKRG